MSDFWAKHQVGGPYATLAESKRALDERADAYPDLFWMMPVEQKDKLVLDYGCGPGHDTVLFLDHGAKRVYYTDASPLALQYARQRIWLHDYQYQTTQVDLWQPLHMDHVHCAGVLHHTSDPLSILMHLRSCLKPSGEGRVMIYDGDRSHHSQSEVPITHWWTTAQFTDLCWSARFEAEYVGSYECSAEWRPDCFAACYRLIPC